MGRIDPDYHGKEAPYSINPGTRRRTEKVIYPDEGPRPASAPKFAPTKAWLPSGMMWGGGRVLEDSFVIVLVIFVF
jgi:hypothetical protein